MTKYLYLNLTYVSTKQLISTSKIAMAELMYWLYIAIQFDSCGTEHVTTSVAFYSFLI